MLCTRLRSGLLEHSIMPATVIGTFDVREHMLLILRRNGIRSTDPLAIVEEFHRLF